MILDAYGRPVEVEPAPLEPRALYGEATLEWAFLNGYLGGRYRADDDDDEDA